MGANVQPADARTLLARGTLDTLKMQGVPVAIGTDGNAKNRDDDFSSTVAATGFNYLIRKPDYSSGESLLLRVYTEAAPQSLTLLLVSSLTDAAAFVRAHEALFVEKTSRVVIQGGVDERSLDESSDYLVLDSTSNNHKYDIEAAKFVYRRCQELGVRLMVMTRFAVYAAATPAFIFDELATIGHPVALRLRENQIKSTNEFWQRCNLPDGHADRLGLPSRCDRAWFAKQCCGGADLSSVQPDAPIWPYVTSVSIYDALSLLAASPTALARFFEVDIKQVKTIEGEMVEHMVVGTSEERNGVRDVLALKSFITNALRYALSASVDDAKAMVLEESNKHIEPF